jgi:hypothetical protein
VHETTLIVSWAELVGIAVVLFIPFYGCYVLRDRLNLAYTDYPLRFAGYFLLCSLLAIWFFRAAFATAPVNTNFAIPALVLLGTFVLTAVIYASGKKRLPDVASVVQPYRAIHNKWVAFDGRYMVAKSADVLYQQVCLVLVVLLLHVLLPSLLALVLLFAGLFGLVHLLIYIYWYWTKRVPFSSVIVFSAFSTLGGLVMPLLILQVPFGFVYSYCVHELYFPAVGAGFRFYLAKRAQTASTHTS